MMVTERNPRAAWMNDARWRRSRGLLSEHRMMTTARDNGVARDAAPGLVARAIGTFAELHSGTTSGTKKPAALVGRRVLVLANLLALVLLGAALTTAQPEDMAGYGDRSFLEDGQTTTRTGTAYALTDSFQSFDRTVRIGAQDAGLVLDRTALVCHDGRAQITWHTGNLEPTVPDTYIHLTIRFDGEPLATAMKGSTRGIWDDGPVDIRAVVDCPAGEHTVDLLVRAISGAWGIPYVVTPGQPTEDGLTMLRGFVIEETY